MKRRQKNQAVPRATGTDRKSRGRNKPGVMMPAPTPLQEMPENYGEFLAKLKERISSERVKAILSANSALVLMYWDIGQSILERQHNEGWGAKVIDRLSHDLKTAFPDMSGFSPRNLKYMRKFAESWPDKTIVQEVLAQITWYHNLALLEKNKEPDVRLWYARKTIEHGWSRNILAIQIETRLYERQGRTINNFSAALPTGNGR